MKDRITIPEGLKRRVDGLVKRHAKALKTSEQDARRVVEISIIQSGIEQLEQRAREELEP